jgi:F-type H+-transporting ATPase subunit epsilon
VNLTVLLPSRVFISRNEVMRVVVETSQGSWGILPHRRDCVAVLVPGLLTFETKAEGVVYAAVDVGVLVKAGAHVQISVRRALLDTDLERLRDTVEREYAVLDQTEREVRRVSEKLESEFLRRMVVLQRE